MCWKGKGKLQKHLQVNSLWNQWRQRITLAPNPFFLPHKTANNPGLILTPIETDSPSEGASHCISPEPSSEAGLGNATPALFKTLLFRDGHLPNLVESQSVVRLWLARPSAQWFSQLHRKLIRWVWNGQSAQGQPSVADSALGHTVCTLSVEHSSTAHLASYDVIGGAE